MSTFIRGPVCGVDNCPSRLWRVIAGRRTCQYGHVMEGDIEFNNDDDEAGGGVITRRLNLTTNALGSFQSSLSLSQLDNNDNRSQNSRKSKKIYGIEADILYIKSFQYVLKKQCNYLIQHEKFPPNFQDTVKLLWVEYLNFLDKNKNISNVSRSRQMTDDDLDDEIIDASDKANSKVNNSNKYKKLSLHLNTMISILYLSCIHMKLPFYLCDFMRVIAATSFPYLKASTELPKQWKDKLPNYYLLELQSNKIPSHLQIINKIYLTYNELQFDKNFNALFNVDGLLFKLINMVILPPEFYFYTKTLVSLMFSEDNMHSMDNGIRLFDMDNILTKKCSSEVIITSALILTLRWILLYDGIHTDVQGYSNSWIEAILNTKILDPHDASKINRDRNVTEMLLTSNNLLSEDNIFSWSEDKTLNYLNWLEYNFLPQQTDLNSSTLSIDEKIAFRKLNNIIPLETSKFALDMTSFQNSKPYLDELKEKHSAVLQSQGNPDGPSSHSEEAQKERLVLIHGIESKLLKQFSNDFNINDNSLKECINDIEAKCLQINIQSI